MVFQASYSNRFDSQLTDGETESHNSGKGLLQITQLFGLRLKTCLFPFSALSHLEEGLTQGGGCSRLRSKRSLFCTPSFLPSRLYQGFLTVVLCTQFLPQRGLLCLKLLCNTQWGALQPVLKVNWATHHICACQHMGDSLHPELIGSSQGSTHLTYGLGIVLTRSVACLPSKAFREGAAFPNAGGGSRDLRLGMRCWEAEHLTPVWLALWLGYGFPCLGQVWMNTNPSPAACLSEERQG